MFFIYWRRAIVNHFELRGTGPKLTKKIMVFMIVQPRIKHGGVKDKEDIFR
jgi:hypothetical protein